MARTNATSRRLDQIDDRLAELEERLERIVAARS